MKFCQPHWDRLRAAIDVRGLSHLVAKDGADCAGRLQRELREGKPIVDEYDPLMSCHWMIFNEALRQGGMGLLGTPPEGGSYCPICEAVKATKEPYDELPPGATLQERVEKWWIDGPADAALAFCREKGLVPTPAAG